MAYECEMNVGMRNARLVVYHRAVWITSYLLCRDSPLSAEMTSFLEVTSFSARIAGVGSLCADLGHSRSGALRMQRLNPATFDSSQLALPSVFLAEVAANLSAVIRLQHFLIAAYTLAKPSATRPPSDQPSMPAPRLGVR